VERELNEWDLREGDKRGGGADTDGSTVPFGSGSITRKKKGRLEHATELMQGTTEEK